MTWPEIKSRGRWNSREPIQIDPLSPLKDIPKAFMPSMDRFQFTDRDLDPQDPEQKEQEEMEKAEAKADYERNEP